MPFLGAKEEIVPFIPLILDASIRNTRFGSYVFDVKHAIGQIPCSDVVKGGLEEFSLKNGCDIGDENDDPSNVFLPKSARKSAPFPGVQHIERQNHSP